MGKGTSQAVYIKSRIVCYHNLTLYQALDLRPVNVKSRCILRVFRSDFMYFNVFMEVPVFRRLDQLIDFFYDFPLLKPGHSYLANTIRVGQSGLKIEGSKGLNTQSTKDLKIMLK